MGLENLNLKDIFSDNENPSFLKEEDWHDQTGQLELIIPENDRLIIGAENIERRWSENHQHQLTENARAEILAFPIIAEEVSELLRWASRYNVPVTPRGAGTNLTGSTVPLYGGLVIDLSRMNHILCLDEDTMTLSVEPGVLLEDVQDYVSQRGYFYPPDPGEKNPQSAVISPQTQAVCVLSDMGLHGIMFESCRSFLPMEQSVS